MIAINDLKSYFADAGGEIEGLNGDVFMVFNQTTLAEKIKELPNAIYLIIVIPGAKTRAMDEDNITDPSDILVFMTEKLDSKNITDDDLIKKMANTQGMTDALKRKMVADKRDHDHPGHLMHFLDVNGMSTEPEYNYLGTYGWSLSFKINPTL